MARFKLVLAAMLVVVIVMIAPFSYAEELANGMFAFNNELPHPTGHDFDYRVIGFMLTYEESVGSIVWEDTGDIGYFPNPPGMDELGVEGETAYQEICFHVEFLSYEVDLMMSCTEGATGTDYSWIRVFRLDTGEIIRDTATPPYGGERGNIENVLIYGFEKVECSELDDDGDDDDDDMVFPDDDDDTDDDDDNGLSPDDDNDDPMPGSDDEALTGGSGGGCSCSDS